MQTTVIRGFAGEVDEGLNPTADLSASQHLMAAVAAMPELNRIVRLYRPAPTVAFSTIEKTLPNFSEAVGESLVFGFDPVVRPAGGRMVALDEQWVVLDVIIAEPVRNPSPRTVYNEFGAQFVQVLTELGIDARFGPVAGEYCPGDYSVNARGAVKLVGTAQRVRRGARLFSASIPFDISVSVRELFTRVNQLLELDWQPATLGSIHQEAPNLTIESLEDALLSAFAPGAHRVASLAEIYNSLKQLEPVS